MEETFDAVTLFRNLYETHKTQVQPILSLTKYCRHPRQIMTILILKLIL